MFKTQDEYFSTDAYILNTFVRKVEDLLSSWASSFPRKSILKISLISSSGKQSATAKVYASRTSRCGSKEPTNTEKCVNESLN